VQCTIEARRQSLGEVFDAFAEGVVLAGALELLLQTAMD
jgi:hypothetical protein